jgi:hypothetical protein
LLHAAATRDSTANRASSAKNLRFLIEPPFGLPTVSPSERNQEAVAPTPPRRVPTYHIPLA